MTGTTVVARRSVRLAWKLATFLSRAGQRSSAGHRSSSPTGEPGVLWPSSDLLVADAPSLLVPCGCRNSAVVVDLPRWGPMLSPRVPNLVPIPGPWMERETPGQRPRPNYGHPHATNPEYWADKIARNIERDAETTDYLQQAGWTVLRFWEHEDPESVADRVQESVRSALQNETNPGIPDG